MEINQQQKRNLKEVLASLGDTKDMQEMSILETSDIKTTLEQNNKDLKIAINEITALYQKAFTKMQEGILKGLNDLRKSIEESAKSGKQADWSGFFKDMPTMLAQIGDNTGKTSELIRNLKWNASQQLRDVNGSPVNPSIAPFAITVSYDEVQLSDYDVDGNVGTVEYFQAGQLKAELSLTYLDGNLIDVIRVL